MDFENAFESNKKDSVRFKHHSNLSCLAHCSSQNPSDPGVLVLSRFAGAARELTDALIVNPYDVNSVADAIAQLPAKCREAFVLRKVQGLSQRETARKLGLSESTVEKHVGRGIRHLINIFGRGGKSGQAASNDQIPDAERYDSQGKQCADRATGGHMGGPA